MGIRPLLGYENVHIGKAGLQGTIELSSFCHSWQLLDQAQPVVLRCPQMPAEGQPKASAEI